MGSSSALRSVQLRDDEVETRMLSSRCVRETVQNDALALLAGLERRLRMVGGIGEVGGSRARMYSSGWIRTALGINAFKVSWLIHQYSQYEHSRRHFEDYK